MDSEPPPSWPAHPRENLKGCPMYAKIFLGKSLAAEVRFFCRGSRSSFQIHRSRSVPTFLTVVRAYVLAPVRRPHRVTDVLDLSSGRWQGFGLSFGRSGPCLSAPWERSGTGAPKGQSALRAQRLIGPTRRTVAAESPVQQHQCATERSLLSFPMQRSSTPTYTVVTYLARVANSHGAYDPAGGAQMAVAFPPGVNSSTPRA